MTAYKVEPARKALADADEAFLWIYEEAPEASLRWYEGLLEAFQSIRSVADLLKRTFFLKKRYASLFMDATESFSRLKGKPFLCFA